MAGTLFQVTAVGSGAPGLTPPAVNTFYFDADTNPSTPQVVVDLLRDFYTSCAALFTSAHSIVIGSRVLLLSVGNPLPPVIQGGIIQRTVTGTGGPNGTPPQVALVASWRTALAGRSFRGRSYLGPLSSGVLNTNGGSFTSGTTTLVTTAGGTLITGSITASMRIQVYSRTKNVASPIVGVTVNAIPDTQRRRVS
jgi:hypothetical protein